MEIKPVKQKKSPDYPILEYYIKNPGMLSGNIPNRWIKNKYIAASLSIFVLCSNTNCSNPNQKNTEVVTNEKDNNNIFQKIKKITQNRIKIAPIFVHGNGSGATGCIVISPPVFMSEDEALKIITDAFAAEKIQLDTTDCPVIKFKAPPIANDCFEVEDVKAPDANVEIKMDAYNAEYNLAIQFVSTDDFYKFHSDDGCWSSVQGYDTQEAATLIREELSKTKKYNAVVFYDPITFIDRQKNWEIGGKEAEEEAKELLLAQVNNFFEWFKEEFIIK